MTARTLKDRLWITSTVLLVSLLGFTPQIWILPTFLYGWSFVYFTVAFNALLAGLFISYALCVTTDPGTVPPKWEPPSERDNVEVKRSTGGPRYCFKCQASKPARAHHCKTCKKCVLRMDHHCNWVGGCIGYWNYPHFLRFLSFVCWSLCLHLGILGMRIWDLAQGSEHNYFHPPQTHEIVLLVFNLVFGVPVLVSVGIFTLYHYYQLLTNTTTIEAYEKDKVATLIRRGRIQALKYPYDLGWWANVSSVMGRKWWLWAWPLGAHKRAREDPGRGLWYKVGEGSDQYTSLCWPPKDPSYIVRSAPFSTRPPPGRRGSQSSHTSDSSVNLAGDFSDDDDVPLGLLPRRVRRGSEGWEAKSPTYSFNEDRLARIDRERRAWEMREWERKREAIVREFERELEDAEGAR